jgi:hypothetical protein
MKAFTGDAAHSEQGDFMQPTPRLRNDKNHCSTIALLFLRSPFRLQEASLICVALARECHLYGSISKPCLFLLSTKCNIVL